MGPAPCGDGGVDQEEAVHMGQEAPLAAQEEVLHIAPPNEPPLDISKIGNKATHFT